MRECSGIQSKPLVSHQVSVDVLLWLEIGHALRDIFAHLQELDSRWVLLQALPEVRQEAAVWQEFSHYVNGPLCGADAVQLDQVLMAKLPGFTKRRSEVKWAGWWEITANTRHKITQSASLVKNSFEVVLTSWFWLLLWNHLLTWSPL